MFKYQLQVNENIVEVSLNTSDMNQKALLIYSGESSDILIVKNWISKQTGAFGHIIDRATTPIDLDYVLSNNPNWNYKQIEGQKIERYDPGLDKNTVS